MAHLQMRGFQTTQSRNAAYSGPRFESGRIGICILAFSDGTFGPLLSMRSLKTAKTVSPAENFGLTNLPDLKQRQQQWSFFSTAYSKCLWEFEP